MILTLDVPFDASGCAASSWKCIIHKPDPLTDALGLTVGASYTWEQLISKAAAVGLPVGHPLLALTYGLREMSAMANVAGRPAPVAVVVA